MTNKHKYVRHSTAGFILWPMNYDLHHLHVGRTLARLGGEIVSAGFAHIGNGSVICEGESESLGIKSRPDDTVALAKQLGIVVSQAQAEPVAD